MTKLIRESVKYINTIQENMNLSVLPNKHKSWVLEKKLSNDTEVVYNGDNGEVNIRINHKKDKESGELVAMFFDHQTHQTGKAEEVTRISNFHYSKLNSKIVKKILNDADEIEV